MRRVGRSKGKDPVVEYVWVRDGVGLMVSKGNRLRFRVYRRVEVRWRGSGNCLDIPDILGAS